MNDLLRQADRIGSDEFFVMLGTKVLGNGSRVWQLIVRRVIKADRKGFDRSRAGAAHHRHHGAGIQSAAQKGAERHVAHQTDFHRIL